MDESPIRHDGVDLRPDRSKIFGSPSYKRSDTALIYSKWNIVESYFTAPKRWGPVPNILFSALNLMGYVSN